MGIYFALYCTDGASILEGKLGVGLFALGIFSPKICRCRLLMAHKMNFTSMALVTLFAVSNSVFRDN